MKKPLTIAALMLFVAACSGAAFGGPRQEELSATAVVEADALAIRGTTTLVDGSLMSCEVWHSSEDGGLGPGTYMTLTSAEVRGGSFACSTSIAGWPAGTIKAAVSFAPFWPGQPGGVVDTYGKAGQLISGPDATATPDGRMLLVTLSAVH